MLEELIGVILPVVISVCELMGHLYVGYADAGGGYIPDHKTGPGVSPIISVAFCVSEVFDLN